MNEISNRYVSFLITKALPDWRTKTKGISFTESVKSLIHIHTFQYFFLIPPTPLLLLSPVCEAVWMKSLLSPDKKGTSMCFSGYLRERGQTQ